MLTTPPALATKSGTQRMPREARSSLTRLVASWLLAAPAIARARSKGRSRRSARRRARRGQHVDARRHRRRRGRSSGRRAGPRARAAVVDVRQHELGAALGEQLREPSADAADADHGHAAALERGAAEHALAATRTAASTPSAVHGLGSPEPPRSTASPVTWRVPRRSSACRAPRCRRPRRSGTRPRACRRSRRSRAAGRGGRRPRAAVPAGSMITPLPPPSGSPATADLKVIARERRRASRTAASESS